jgi:hypothetical protein
MSDELAVATDQAMQDSTPVESPESCCFVFGVEKFSSQDDLTSYLDKSSMRQADYTQKTQGLADERRRFESERGVHQSEVEALKKLREKYDGYEAAFKKRPQLLRSLEQQIDRPSGPDEVFDRSKGYADEKYTALEERITKWEEAQERQELEARRDEVYARLGEKYEGFDKDTVDAMLGTLEGGDIEPLLDMAYRASAYGSGAGTEERVVEKLARKRGARLPAGGGKTPPTKSGSSNLDESYEQALNEYAGAKGE